MPVATEPATTGVIHDIGYRHYDGARLGQGYIWRSLFSQSLKSTFGIGRTARSKVLPMILVAIMLLPALIAVVVMVVTDADEQAIPYHHYAINVQIQLVIAVFVAAQAPQLFARDLRFRSITLYFARPPTRFGYVSARFLALVAALVMLMAAPLLVMYVGGLMVPLPFGDETVDLLRSLVGIVVLAFILAGIGALLASLTPRRGFAVAAIITLLTMSLAVVASVISIAEVEGNETVGVYAALFSPVTLLDGFQSGVLDLSAALPFEPSAGVETAVFVVVTIVVITASFGLLLLRYRRYRP
jgi:ABC-2 type transport system permease protein